MWTVFFLKAENDKSNNHDKKHITINAHPHTNTKDLHLIEIHFLKMQHKTKDVYVLMHHHHHQQYVASKLSELHLSSSFMFN